MQVRQSSLFADHTRGRAAGSRRGWPSGAALLALAAFAGCAQRPPDADELVNYVRNARVSGPVRKLWDAGQAYIDAVMKQDAAYRRATARLADLEVPTWKADDSHWRDAAAVRARADGLAGLAEPDALQAREDAFAKVAEAVDAVPSGLDRAAVVARVWEALGYAPHTQATLDERHRALLDAHLRVLGFVEQNAAAFRPASQGLVFEDERITRQVAEAHATLMSLQLQTREERLAEAKREETEAEKAIERAREDRRALRSQSSMWSRTAEQGRHLRAIDDEIDYQTARRKLFEAQRKRLEKAG
jgi:hypothetical protein